MRFLIMFLAVMVLSAWLATFVVDPTRSGIDMFAGGLLTWIISAIIMAIILSKIGADDE